MKLFWMLIAMLVVGGATFLAWSSVAASRARALAARDQAVAAMEAARAAEAAAAKGAAQAAPTGAPPAPTPEPKPPVAKAPESPATVGAPAEPRKAEPGPTGPRGAGTELAVSPNPWESGPELGAPESKPAAPAAAPAAPTATAAATEQKAGGTVGASVGKFEIVPSKMEPQEDGSVLVEGAYRMTGDGSVEKPYEIPWELLLVAEKTYNPTEKMTKIPQAIAMLDGKRVRITGYVAFPMYVQEPRELLSMLNQWDGCCIGVPPTPYDAIEVTLKKTVEGDDRMATFGVVEGRFGVKPYVVGDWLVGLYVMDDGTLAAKRYNGSGT